MQSVTVDRAALSGHDSPRLPASDPAAYNAWLQKAQLEAVEQVRVSAERTGEGHLRDVELSVTPEFAIEPNRVLIRYDALALLSGTDGATLGSAGTVVALAFSYDGPTPTPDIVARFALTTGMLVAHPYVREAVQALAARVGFPQATLPLMPIPGPPTAPKMLPEPNS